MVRKISCFVFILAALTLAAATASAQEIRGDVRYLDSGQPVRDASVRCSGTGGISNQVTSLDGKFYFRVSPGNYDVMVTAPGYIPVTRSITLTDFNASEYMAIRLKSDSSAPKTGTSSTVEANVPAAAQKEFDKAEAVMATGKKEAIPEAILHYQQSLTIYPKFLQAQLKLGTAYMDMSEWEHAEQALKKTLELNPNAANALFALGEVYLRQKKNEEAEKILLQWLQAEDRSAQGHLILARVYVDMAAKIKDPDQNRPFRVKAFDQVNASLKYDANNSLAHWIKGNLLVSVGRNVDAQHEFEEYVRLDPKGPWADKAKTLIDRIKKVESEAKP